MEGPFLGSFSRGAGLKTAPNPLAGLPTPAKTVLHANIGALMAFAPFTITRVETHGPDELIERLRRVVMLKDRGTFPYADAKLTLGPLGFDAFRPTQRYVLSDNLLKIQHLGWELSRHGIDLLGLKGYATIGLAAPKSPWMFCPPSSRPSRKPTARS